MGLVADECTIASSDGRCDLLMRPVAGSGLFVVGEAVIVAFCGLPCGARLAKDKLLLLLDAVDSFEFGANGGGGEETAGVLALRASLKLGRDCVGSEVCDLSVRSVEECAAALTSLAVRNAGVVALRVSLAVLRLDLLDESCTSRFAVGIDVGGLVRSSL
jgi:hypothetical protein